MVGSSQFRAELLSALDGLNHWRKKRIFSYDSISANQCRSNDPLVKKMYLCGIDAEAMGRPELFRIDVIIPFNQNASLSLHIYHKALEQRSVASIFQHVMICSEQQSLCGL